MKPFLPIRITFLFLIAFAIGVSAASAHHFKGLPHYNYFENYPQIPEEEFLGRAGEYELSLVIYDFQGIKKENTRTPDNVRLYLVIFNLRNNVVYGGPLTLEVLDRGTVIHSERHASSELENLYSMHRELPETGKYSLRITMHDENELACEIPFLLSHQKVHWGKWIGAILLILLIIAAIGARRARVAMDRKAEAKHRTTRSATPKAAEAQDLSS